MQRMNMILASLLLVVTVQTDPGLQTEQRIVQYLSEHVKPGQPVIVSDLYNNTFKSPEERQVLDRLFNTFFKIPLFVAQFQAGTGQPPTLAEISRQFNFRIDGEASVILSIMDNDPRVPRFITRNAATGEITSVDVEKVRKDKRFGQVLERTLQGWPGKDVPPFSLTLFDGKPLVSDDLDGQGFLMYFWFSGCPPCVRMAPNLVQVQHKFGRRKFSVVGVNADRLLELETTDADRAAYVRKAGFTFPVGHLTKKMQEDFGNISVYPTMFLVNSKGVVRKYYVNYQSLETLSKDIEEMLQAGETDLLPSPE
jgi:thiol-disulfide isomerase/thioredoxin